MPQGKSAGSSNKEPRICEYEEVEGIKMCCGRKSFYNPAQKFNRDISVLVIKNFLKTSVEAKLLETMSASGIRGIRYAKELGSKVHVFFNDINAGSVAEIGRNVALNSLDQNKITVCNEDCNSLMGSRTAYFDVVDIDPFGSCNIFMENAIKSTKHNGLLAVTATDTAVLCSNEEKCFVKYNTIIKRNPACHEHALRTVLSFISRTAARQNAGIEPILSISVDFYVRLFVRVIKNRSAARKSTMDNSFYLICDCFSTKEVPINKRTSFCTECELCKKEMKLCGPFWNKDLHNKGFVKELKTTVSDPRMTGLLNVIDSEMNTFGYFSISDMGRFVKCDAISMKKIVFAIANAGYDVSVTHCKLNSLKTNAPLGLLYSAILKNSNRDNKDLNIETHDVNFDYNKRILDIKDPEFHRGILHSHMGPLSRKKL